MADAGYLGIVLLKVLTSREPVDTSSTDLVTDLHAASITLVNQLKSWEKSDSQRDKNIAAGLLPLVEKLREVTADKAALAYPKS